MSKWGVVAAAALVAGGCSLPDAPPSPAVFTLFDRFRGQWEIFELPRNAPAISFWRGVCGAYRDGRFAETSDASHVRQVIDTTE